MTLSKKHVFEPFQNYRHVAAPLARKMFNLLVNVACGFLGSMWSH